MDDQELESLIHEEVQAAKKELREECRRIIDQRIKAELGNQQLLAAGMYQLLYLIQQGTKR